MSSKAGDLARRALKAIGTVLALALAGLYFLLQETGPGEPDRPAEPERRAPPTAADDAPCIVDQVSDGDTLRCQDGRRIRLLLIDTPERSQKPYGDRARTELAKLLPSGTETRVELDVRPRDQYGRTLAYLYAPDGKMVNREMVRRGYAVVLTYPPNVRHVDAISAAQANARKAKRGLWSTPAFECSPRDFRARRCR